MPRRESWPASRTVTPCGEQRAERDDLAEAPVDAALGGHLGPPLEQLLDPLVRGEALRQLDVRLADRARPPSASTAVSTCGLRLVGRGPRPAAARSRAASRVALKTCSSCCW